jgi:hypothetical protein
VIGGVPTLIIGLLALPALTRIDRKTAPAAAQDGRAGDGAVTGPGFA